MHRFIEGEHAALYVMAHVGDALAAAIKEDILGNRDDAVAGFKRLHELASGLYAQHRELFEGSHRYIPVVRVRSMVNGRWTTEDVIRRELEMAHGLPMDGISDREITTYGRRFRARLRDLQLAKAAGQDALRGFLDRLATGDVGWEEIGAIYWLEMAAIDETGCGSGTPLPSIRRALRPR